MSTTLIKNGKVISSTGVIAQDVLLDGETIRALGAPGYFTEEGMDRVIDAAGKYVIPGGIDVHTHMELPFGGTFASDTFETGSRAAAWGGTTTIIDMAVQRYGEDVHAGAGADCPYSREMIFGPRCQPLPIARQAHTRDPLFMRRLWQVAFNLARVQLPNTHCAVPLFHRESSSIARKTQARVPAGDRCQRPLMGAGVHRPHSY